MRRRTFGKKKQNKRSEREKSDWKKSRHEKAYSQTDKIDKKIGFPDVLKHLNMFRIFILYLGVIVYIQSDENELRQNYIIQS